MPAQTLALGRALAEVTEGPSVVALVGDLGCGKTCFAQGVGEGIGVEEDVLSPTFVLVNEYEGRLPLLHADVFRLESNELESIGLEEMLEIWPGLALVEWADRFKDLLPERHLRVTIEDLGGTHRRLSFEPIGPSAESWLRRLRRHWERPCE